MCIRNLTLAVAGLRLSVCLRATLVLLVVGGVLLLGVSHGAADVIAPTAAIGTPASFGSPTNLINGSGLSGVGDILTQTHQSTHLLGWLKDNVDPTNELVFLWLGGTADLTGLYAWQYEQAGCCNGRGVNTFDVSFSTDHGANYSAPISLSLDSSLVVPGDETVQTRAFPLQTGVTNVKFTNMTDFPALPNPGWQGLNEVRFEGTATDLPPFEPADGSIAVGSALTPRDFASDGSPLVFFTNYEAMPDDGTVDSVSVFFQASNNTFEVHQLRPTGNADEYQVVYSSGTIIPFGTADQIESFPFPDGPVDVLAGDIFGHYGRGIPYSSVGGTNADNAHPIFFPIEADAAPQLGDLLTISDVVGGSSRGAFPIRTDLSRDYAMAVNFLPVPEPSTAVLALAGLCALALAISSRRRLS